MLAGPVIITRAEPGNGETAARIAEHGLPYISAPMLEIVPTGADLPAIENITGLLFTSANGVRAFAEASDRRDLTAWCVGPATLAAAREAGFEDLRHGNGDASDLASLVEREASPHKGTLLHVANDAAAGTLVARLQQSGFSVGFAPLYTTVPTEMLPGPVRETLTGQSPACVLIHSAKGAEAFAKLVRGFDLSPHLLVAVSAKAAAPLAGFRFAETHIAPHPNEATLLDVLFRTYSVL